jgi:hypothetical protein
MFSKFVHIRIINVIYVLYKPISLAKLKFFNYTSVPDISHFILICILPFASLNSFLGLKKIFRFKLLEFLYKSQYFKQIICCELLFCLGEELTC